MHHIFQQIMTYIHQNPHIGILIAFLIALAESLPLIGTIIPGSITMTAMGTMVGTGLLPGFYTLAWASLGALVGDTIGFAVGYLFTDHIRKIWPFRKYPHWLQASEQFFEKHGGKSIIFGRFVGPARSTVPLVAGLLKMTWLRFILAAIPSAIMWAVLYMTPGILIGALAVELPPHIATEFILIGLLVIVALWLIFWAIQYFFAQLARAINRMIDKCWDALIRHKPSRPFIRIIAVKGNPADHYQLMLSILFLIALLLFLFVFYSVMTGGWLTKANIPIFHLFQSLRTERLNSFFTAITFFGYYKPTLIASLLICAGLTIVRQWRAAIHFMLLILLMVVSIHFFKTISNNPRPTGFFYVAPSSSFPSGHTSMGFIIFATLAYFSGKLVKHSLKWVPYTIGITLIVLIAISRLYLGAHWLTDILGSFTLGFSVLFLVVINYRRRAYKTFQKINKTYWFVLVVISVLLPWSIWTFKDFHFDKKLHTPVWPVVSLSTDQWWKKPTSYLPLYRLNRFGKPIQPFNLQWAGNIASIQNTLIKKGWTLVDPKFSVKGTLKRFAMKDQPYPLPILPWLYHHQTPILILMKTTRSGNTIELRLWNSDAQFTDSRIPLWLGTINFHISPAKKISFANFKQVSLQESGGIKQLKNDLETLNIYQYQLIQIPRSKQPERVLPLHWDGHVIIIRNIPYSQD